MWARLVYKQLFLDLIPEDKRQFYKVYIEADGEKYFCPRRHISKKTDLQGHRGIKGKILFLKFQRFKKSNVCFNIKTPWRRKSSIYNSFTIYLRFGWNYFIISLPFTIWRRFSGMKRNRCEKNNSMIICGRFVKSGQYINSMNTNFLVHDQVLATCLEEKNIPFQEIGHYQ